MEIIVIYMLQHCQIHTLLKYLSPFMQENLDSFLKFVFPIKNRMTEEKIGMTDMLEKPVGYYSNIRPEMYEFIPVKAGKILEAGCGEGIFASQVKEKLNAEVWGLELDFESAEIASKKIDKVLQGDIALTISQLPKNYFDCIIFNDVLEHLVNPYEVLEALKQNLAPNGVIVSSIPNARYWRVFKMYVFGKNWKYENDGVMDRTHLRFFTKRSISEMFENLKYDVVTIKGLKPTPSVGFQILNALTFGSLSDCKYIQYACVAKPKK